MLRAALVAAALIVVWTVLVAAAPTDTGSVPRDAIVAVQHASAMPALPLPSGSGPMVTVSHAPIRPIPLAQQLVAMLRHGRRT